MDNGLFAKRIVFSEASRSDLQVSVTEWTK
jgi:hypothetical protein